MNRDELKTKKVVAICKLYHHIQYLISFKGLCVWYAGVVNAALQGKKRRACIIRHKQTA
jgi:hypothetical protein